MTKTIHGKIAWIDTIADEQAGPALKRSLDNARTPSGTVDNVMRVHSLRPHTMDGHVALYRSVLHNDANTLPPWLAETIGSYVCVLNDCTYSYHNHWSNARHLIEDERRALEIEKALLADDPEAAFSGAELAMLRYTRKLTLRPGAMEAADVAAMRNAGVSDSDILEVNQVISYFCYVHRLLNGLGVTTAGDVIGYYEQAPPSGELDS